MSKLKGGQGKLIAKKSSKESPLKKPVSARVAAVKGKVRSNSEPSILPMTEQRRQEGRSRNNTGLPQGGEIKGQKVEELRKRDDVMQQEVDQSVEIRQRISEMEGTILVHKLVVEKCTGELTTLTHQLTDTVSEIEEIELKIENLRKALKVSCSNSDGDV